MKPRTAAALPVVCARSGPEVRQRPAARMVAHPSLNCSSLAGAFCFSTTKDASVLPWRVRADCLLNTGISPGGCSHQTKAPLSQGSLVTRRRQDLSTPSSARGSGQETGTEKSLAQEGALGLEPGHGWRGTQAQGALLRAGAPSAQREKYCDSASFTGLSGVKAEGKMQKWLWICHVVWGVLPPSEGNAFRSSSVCLPDSPLCRTAAGAGAGQGLPEGTLTTVDAVQGGHTALLMCRTLPTRPLW